MELILDVGSCNSNPDVKIAKKIIDSIANVDKKRVCILKYQLWAEDNPQGKNKRLTHEIFEFAYKYATQKGFKVTASVFDLKSLKYLLKGYDIHDGQFNDGTPIEMYIPFDIPFIKIANRRDLYWLIEKIPRTIKVYVSYDNEAYLPKCLGSQDKTLYCVSKYPSSIDDYETSGRIGLPTTNDKISDHTTGLELFNKYKYGLKIWEKHYVLNHDTTNLDGGLFAITPKQLKEILK